MQSNFTPIKPKFAKKNRETILPSRMAQVVNDIIAILLFAISAMLGVAFATHSALDSCWSKSLDSTLIANKLGVIGSYSSDIFFYIFGASAWWFVLGIFYLGFYKIRRKKITTGGWGNIYRIISYIVLISASATFEYLSFNGQSTTLPDGFGGSLGSWLFSVSSNAVGEVGVSIISLLLIIICMSFSFSVSWLFIAEKVGASIEWVYLTLAGLVSRKESPLRNKEYSSEPANSIEVPNSQNVDNLESESSEQNSSPVKSFAARIFGKSHVETVQDNDIKFDLDDPIFESDKLEDQLPDTEIPTSYTDTDLPVMPLTPQARTKGLRSGLTSNHVVLKKSDLLQDFAKSNLPSTNLLNLPRSQSEGVSPETIAYVSNAIENTLAEFGVEVKICNVESGPVVTCYELVPPKGVRGDKIANLAKEIARSLALPMVRIVETIPGKNSMGIEVPNFKRQTIYLKEIFDSNVYRQNNSLLTLALGKDTSGEVIVTDLAKMPHLLVAGTTGSGKSVAINGMILSILFNATPDEVKFIMIDPKMVELSFYQDIPHLLAPVVTDMSQAANALKWVVGEMEQRYKIMAKIGTKNIISFNQKIEAAIKEGKPLYNPYVLDNSDPEPLKKWPYIVVIIDELADLMMVAGKKIEQYIARIAQKARAIGIHLIVATQRPSVDVITGLIKANIPARISFLVSNRIDSRTILDQQGAEALLGQGDMLFLNPGSGFPRRIHGAFVNDDELHKVVEYLKEQGSPDYVDEILTGADDISIPGFDEDSGDTSNIEKDAIFDEAANFILTSKRCSISSLQTQFGIGYNKAARFMNHFEKIGMVRRNDRGQFDLVNKT